MFKKTLFLLTMTALMGYLVSCTGSESASAGAAENGTEATAEGAENGSATAATSETASGAAEQAAETKRKKASDPVARATAVFEQMGLELTPEQSAMVSEISAKYDLKGAPDRETRRAMLQQYLQEVADNVLTAEQRVKYDEHRASQEEKKKNR